MPQSTSPNERRHALLALLAVTVIWGWTFVWMKQALSQAQLTLGKDGEAAARGLFLALRFGVAAMALPLLLPSCRTVAIMRPRLWIDGGSLGLLLIAGFLLQMTALSSLSPAVSSFLTSLYVIFTAFLSLFSAKHRNLSVSLLVACVLATLGAAYISGPPQLSFGLAEWLTVLSAFLFACTILVTDTITRRHAPTAVSLSSFTVVAIGSTAYTVWTLGQEGAPTLPQLLGLLREYDFWMPLACCSILATLIALTTLNYYQRMLEPVRAATLYAMEPVWGTIISVMYGMEIVNGWFALGAGALLAGNLIAELSPKSRKA